MVDLSRRVSAIITLNYFRFPLDMTRAGLSRPPNPPQTAPSHEKVFEWKRTFQATPQVVEKAGRECGRPDAFLMSFRYALLHAWNAIEWKLNVQLVTSENSFPVVLAVIITTCESRDNGSAFNSRRKNVFILIFDQVLDCVCRAFYHATINDKVHFCFSRREPGQVLLTMPI